MKQEVNTLKQRSVSLELSRILKCHYCASLDTMQATHMRAFQTKDNNKLFFKPQGDHLVLGSLLNLLRDKHFLPSI